MLKFWSSGGCLPRQRASTLWCWICRCWTPDAARPDGHFPERHCFAGAFLCGGERAHQHPAASGRGHCSGKSQRHQVWKACRNLFRKTSIKSISSGKWENYRYSCCKAVRDATFHFPVSGGGLRKNQIVVSGYFYRNV